jgi:ElaB/YqjD/DUF883 family membrane-anchored ribosome-binding protein
MQIKPDVFQPAANRGGIRPALAISADGVATGATNEFQNFVADMDDLVTKSAAATGEELTIIKARLSARIVAAKESIQEMGGVVIARARKTATATNNYVHEQPWQAVGIGAAAGVLLGFVLGRRK